MKTIEERAKEFVRVHYPLFGITDNTNLADHIKSILEKAYLTGYDDAIFLLKQYKDKEVTVTQTLVCPICGGKGHVLAGYYWPYSEKMLTSLEPQICKTCGGKGYIIQTIKEEL